MVVIIYHGILILLFIGFTVCAMANRKAIRVLNTVARTGIILDVRSERNSINANSMFGL